MPAAAGMLTSVAEKTSRWTAAVGGGGETATKRIFQDSSWADGLRGIAAVFVMLSHMTLCFARYIVRPAGGEHGDSFWFQRPILRLVVQGPAWVAVFFVVSGFVNALKPIKSARQGQIEASLSNMAVSAFRRSFRLFLPATAATALSWFICQFGAYETARNSEAYWLRITSPAPSNRWGVAVEDLLKAIGTTWIFNPGNAYDQPQWALLYLLQGSMIVFTTLLVTVNLTPRFRVSVLTLCWIWAWNWAIRLGDPLVGVNVFAGILLAEFNDTGYPMRLSRYSPIFAPPLTIISLVLMSFPAEYHSLASWSTFLLHWFERLAPKDTEVARFWPSLGVQLLCFTIICSPHMRRFLSLPFLLWLGKLSFPLYLLHGSFMRSLLSWMLFANQTLQETEERHGDGPENTATVMRYPLPGVPTFILVMPIFFIILFSAVHVWAAKVEPYFGLVTKKAEEVMFGKSGRPPALPVRQD